MKTFTKSHRASQRQGDVARNRHSCAAISGQVGVTRHHSVSADPLADGGAGRPTDCIACIKVTMSATRMRRYPASDPSK
ncbi:MAG: hypothetical protein ACK56F_16815, partial [bacterium]